MGPFHLHQQWGIWGFWVFSPHIPAPPLDRDNSATVSSVTKTYKARTATVSDSSWAHCLAEAPPCAFVSVKQNTHFICVYLIKTNFNNFWVYNFHFFFALVHFMSHLWIIVRTVKAIASSLWRMKQTVFFFLFYFFPQHYLCATESHSKLKVQLCLWEGRSNRGSGSAVFLISLCILQAPASALMPRVWLCLSCLPRCLQRGQRGHGGGEAMASGPQRRRESEMWCVPAKVTDGGTGRRLFSRHFRL